MSNSAAAPAVATSNVNGGGVRDGVGSRAGAYDAHDESNEKVNVENLLAVSAIVIKQAVDFLNDNVTADEQLSFRSQYMPGSTIGKHLRHARDHYVLLLDAVKGHSNADGSDPKVAAPELSYDTRTRNTPMENSRAAALEALQSCILQLQEIVPRTRLDMPLVLHAVTPYMQTFNTTFGRELWFAALHAVHHWSMIRVVAGELNMTLEESFGIAPSTLVYHDSEAPLGKSRI